MQKVQLKTIGTLGESGNFQRKNENFWSFCVLLLVSSNIDAASQVPRRIRRPETNYVSYEQQAVSIGMTRLNFERFWTFSKQLFNSKDLFALTHYLFTKPKTVFWHNNADKYSLANRTWSNANHQFSSRDNYFRRKNWLYRQSKKNNYFSFQTNFEDYGDKYCNNSKTDNRTQDINNILDYLMTMFISLTKNNSDRTTLLWVLSEHHANRGLKLCL